MNLLCPHCQQMLSVQDQSAGQVMKCPLCNNSFPVPALPASRPEPATLPSEIPLVPLPPAPEPASAATPKSPEHEEPVYKIATEPQKPPPPPLFPSRPRGEPKSEGIPRRDERITATPSRSPVPPPPTAQPPPPSPPPTGYVHSASFSLSPHVVAWITPLALVPLWLLLFFPWVGVYPGGYGIYTQNAFQAMVGAYSRDQVGEKVLKNDEETSKVVQRAYDPHKSESEEDLKGLNLHRAIQHNPAWGNWLLLFYLLILLLALPLAAALLVLEQASIRMPPFLELIWPWRSALLVGGLSLAFLILLLEISTSFSLEAAVKNVVNKSLETANEKASTPEEQESLRIREGLELGRFQLQRTGWLRWAVFFHLVAIAGAGLELWLEKRGQRPTPRLDVMW